MAGFGVNQKRVYKTEESRKYPQWWSEEWRKFLAGRGLESSICLADGKEDWEGHDYRDNYFHGESISSFLIKKRKRKIRSNSWKLEPDIFKLDISTVFFNLWLTTGMMCSNWDWIACAVPSNTSNCLWFAGDGENCSSLWHTEGRRGLKYWKGKRRRMIRERRNIHRKH